MFLYFGWIGAFTLIGISAQILLLRLPRRKAGRRPGWAVPLALAVWALFRLRRRWIGALLTTAFVLMFPFFMGTANDGGSRLYGAALYDITFLHRLPEGEGQPYVTGTEFRPLHLEL